MKGFAVPETIEPKNCPFCKAVGHEVFPDTVMPDVPDGVRYHVGCWNCGARGPAALSESEAVKKWNRRPHDFFEITSVTLDFSKMSEEDIQELHRLLDSRDDVTISSMFTTSELNQSVISWTRYDGTLETLPPAGLIVFIYSPQIGTTLPVTTIFNGNEWEVNMTTPHDAKPFYLKKKPALGDMWTPLPEPPEAVK